MKAWRSTLHFFLGIAFFALVTLFATHNHTYKNHSPSAESACAICFVGSTTASEINHVLSTTLTASTEVPAVGDAKFFSVEKILLLKARDPPLFAPNAKT